MTDPLDLSPHVDFALRGVAHMAEAIAAVAEFRPAASLRHQAAAVACFAAAGAARALEEALARGAVRYIEGR
jgi:hypothetical protein